MFWLMTVVLNKAQTPMYIHSWQHIHQIPIHPLERMYLPKKNTFDFKVNDSSQDVMK